MNGEHEWTSCCGHSQTGGKRSGKGFVVDNLLLISRKSISTFMDAECNIHICLVGQTGFLSKYYENFTVSALPHGEGPRHSQGTGRLVNTLQYRAPKSRIRPAGGEGVL